MPLMIVPLAAEPVAPVDDDGEHPRAGEEARQLQRVEDEGPHGSIDGRGPGHVHALDGSHTWGAAILMPP